MGALTRVERRVPPQALVPLLEGPEDGEEQHVVSRLSSRVQKLAGGHVVVGACASTRAS